MRGELAQLGERLVCNQEVTGSIPVFSTKLAEVPRSTHQVAALEIARGSRVLTPREAVGSLKALDAACRRQASPLAYEMSHRPVQRSAGRDAAL